MSPEPVFGTDDVESFRLHVCQRLVSALGKGEENNIDRSYPPYEVVAGQAAFDDLRARFLAFLTGHWDGMARSYSRFEDDTSRKLFVDLLLFRALGCRHVRLDSNTPEYWDARKQSEALEAEPSSFAGLPGGAGLCHFVLPLERRSLQLDCLRANIFFTFLMRQYFFDRGGMRVQPEIGDHVVDAGACFGDTAVDFAETVGESGYVYSFDPLEAHVKITSHNIQQNDLSNLTVFGHGLSDHDFEAPPVDDLCDPGFAQADVMPVRRLDALVAAGTIPRIDFIKMDIEGSELAALRGAEAALRSFRPKLAISVYHRWDDYFAIPDFIAGLNLGYRFFLQSYTVGEGETILYCIAASDDETAATATSRDEAADDSIPSSQDPGE